MTLKYHWNDVVLNVPDKYSQSFTPHTHQVVSDIDYEYETIIDARDIIDYLLPYSMNTKKTHEQEIEQSYASAYMVKLLKFLNSVNAIYYDALEDDEYFREFMHDRYEEDAWEEFQDSNEEY